jgi:hypothetical protein
MTIVKFILIDQFLCNFEDYLTNRAKRAKKSDFRKILDNVSNRKPIPGDEFVNISREVGSRSRVAGKNTKEIYYGFFIQQGNGRAP